MYFPHRNVFPGASRKRGKKGNLRVSPDTRSLSLHPHVSTHMIIRFVDYSGIVPELCHSQDDQRKAH